MPNRDASSGKTRARTYEARNFRLHIDHLDNPREDVWAISWKEPNGRRKYLTAQGIYCKVPVITVFRGKRATQPRAFLEGCADVVVTSTCGKRYVLLTSYAKTC
jgi:hypothetical protein